METKGIDIEQLKKKLEKPVKLSDAEKKKIEEIFTDLNKLFGDVRREVLEMDQPDAYRYMDILLRKFVEAKAEFEGKISTVIREPGPGGAAAPVRVNRKPGDFREFFDQLSPGQQEIAKRLDCVKTALQLEGEGGDPSQALCDDCSLEGMISCVRTEDPSIHDEMDMEFHLASEKNRAR